MKKLYFLSLLSLLSLFAFKGYTQTAASYLFTAFNTPYSSIASTGVPVTAGTCAGGIFIEDDCMHISIPIGFNFTYCGVTYTQLSASTNGWLSLPNYSGFSTFTNFAASLPALSGGVGFLMAYWDDLKGYPAIPTAAYYETSGSAPNRVFTFEWKDFGICCTSSLLHANFQIRLYENTNAIDFCYGPSTFAAMTATIGIANSSTDWQTLPNGGTSPTPSATVFTSTVNILPANGQVFRWYSQCTGTPAPGTPVATATTGCFAYTDTLSLSGTSVATGLTYQWQSSTDSSTWTNITGATNARYIFTVTTTLFYRCVVTCSYSALSANSEGKKIALNSYPAAIGGPTTVCVGSAITLTNDSLGGTWSSISTLIATVGSSSGTVTGASPGTATILYYISSGCPAMVTVNVNPAPTAITGTPYVCVGSTTALSDAVGGGSWSSSITSVATVDPATGLVRGLTPGSTVITYSLGGTCPPVTATVNVYPVPTAITGITHVCSGATTALSSTPSGGTWGSVSTAIATVGTGGIVTGAAGGITTITYSTGPGCTVSTPLTVNTAPAAISGFSLLCLGATVAFYDGTPGGSWSSSTSAATVDVVTGYVTGAALGPATISYTLSTGCFATIPVTVTPAPAGITGTLNVCIGAVTDLDNATPGGTWASADNAIASVDLISGVVTGGSVGVTAISYTLSSGCAAAVNVTVNPGPLPIAGIPKVCVGDITFLGDITSGGAWSVLPTAIATVDPVTGVVRGVASGTALVSYTISTGCRATYTVTVNPSPAGITGSTGICVGLTTALSDPTPGGSWSSGNMPVATVDAVTGVVKGLAIGTAPITYMLPTGCLTTVTVTVNSSPGAILGLRSVCAGATTSLSDLTGGGTWSSGSMPTATIGTASGIVSGLAPGTTIITYSLGAGCSVTAVVTVNPLPGAISGIATVCVGMTTTLGDPSPGGSWSTTSTLATVISTGAVTGTSAGPAIITYTLPATGCFITRAVTVNPLPALIGGVLSLCPSATTLLTDATAGGTWSPATGPIATVTSGGMVTGVSSGTALISYTLSTTGCVRTTTVTVNPLPAVITGNVPLCAGNNITLTDATGGGSWTPATGSIATVTLSGIVTGVAAGTAPVTYTLPTGCSRTAVVTVNPLPAAIVGPTAVCVGSAITETDALTGGTWISGTTSVATIIPSGAGSALVTGASTGSTIITYTLPTGCSITTTVTVSLSPGPIGGPSTLCAGNAVTLADIAGGGVWTSSNTAAATIGSLTGTVTGAMPGVTTITYSLGTGCTVTKVMTVNAAPAAIGGAANVCIGSSVTLTDATGGGAWSSADAGIASVTGSGLVTGGSAGTDTIFYTRSGCASFLVITVNPAPSAIGGPSDLCAGTTIILVDGVGGGVWGPVSGSIATVDAGTGVVTGISGGTVIFTYSLGAGCIATKTIMVNPVSPITGSTGICVGATTMLSDATPGGTWVSGTTSVATIISSGLVTSASVGTTIITYTTAAGCKAMVTVTVNTAPSAIGGTPQVCVGTATTLTNAAGGGVWSSSLTSIATVNATTGLVRGVAPGTSVITYSLGTGCTTTRVVTVNTSPPAIAGPGTVCEAATIALTDAVPGGTWACLMPSVATVVAGSGVVTGVASGTVDITYTPGTGCFAIKTVTVNPLPAQITGTATICVGLSTDLSETTAGGTWASSNTGVATVASPAPGTGTVTGAASGIATINYTLPTGCSVGKTVTVIAAPSAISGTRSMCVGASSLLGDPTGGGVWSTDGSGNATVSPAGLVTGLSLGTTVVSYTAYGCPMTAVVTVNSLPGAISGPAQVCVGSAISLTDMPVGGVWSSPGGVGIVITDAASGTVTGVGTGIAAITYSMGAGCNVSTVVTVNPLPLPPASTGGASICAGFTTAYTDLTPGGTWSCSPASVATISGMGLVSGIGGGIVTISYTLGTGCSATTSLSVTAVSPITGADHVCSFGDTASVFEAMAGGTWSSTFVTISAAGVVTGFSTGIGIVTYTLGSGCYATRSVTVNPVPAPITGIAHFCMTATSLLSDATPGGAWSSSAGGAATISATGLVNGVSAGTESVSYTLLSTGCRSTVVVTLDPMPWAGTIIGASSVCPGAMIALANSVTGGVWSSASTGIATITGAGLVSGVSAGTDTIKYTYTNTCGTAVAAKTVLVNSLPDAGAITGTDSLCVGAAIYLSDAITGGVWTSGNSNATIGSATGKVNGMAAGADTVTYSVTNVCGTAAATFAMRIKPLPVAGMISGQGQVCIGEMDTLTGTPQGGIWSVHNANATISNGVVTGVAEGADTVYYTISNDCGSAAAAYPVFINKCDTGIGPGPGVGVSSVHNEGSEMLHVYPNPNKGVFVVMLSSGLVESVSGIVSNIVGEKVKEFTVTTNKQAEIQLNNAAGIYLLSVSTAHGRHVMKVIVE